MTHHYPDCCAPHFRGGGLLSGGGKGRSAGAWVGKSRLDVRQRTVLAGTKALRPRKPLTPSLILFPCKGPTHSKARVGE